MITEIVSFNDLRVGDTFWIEGFKSEVQNYSIMENGVICLVTLNLHLHEVEYLSTKFYGGDRVLRKVNIPIIPDTIEQFLGMIDA